MPRRRCRHLRAWIAPIRAPDAETAGQGEHVGKQPGLGTLAIERRLAQDPIMIDDGIAILALGRRRRCGTDRSDGVEPGRKRRGERQKHLYGELKVFHDPHPA